ncbi:aldehyde dehydrogenase (NADP(+)) [Conexibacter sp. S30A1]|uniref:aldehyde dehydrogenase (NADP(+)) n=1 Tax=Conexibacter sp. S30A1 TaxID=2937800 RepID=UPI00200FB458|nr:aldehyde dehydrogenase (NADP(+)) [Conexibacter sp. S30A1]
MSQPVADRNGDALEETLSRTAAASLSWGSTSPDFRASALELVAAGLEGARDELVPLAARETHLSTDRLAGELTRTTFQLRAFAGALRGRSFGDTVIDHADPDWPSGPRPDLRVTTVALGPVLVFAGGNFPFAFSTAGGDTASALAAGCAVMVKAHPGHPELSSAVGTILGRCLLDAGAPHGTFAQIFAEAEARDVLADARIAAGAFTGSLDGGRALFDIAAARSDPIPFYAEMGSVNPVFVTPGAVAARRTAIVNGFLTSMMLGAGQFCTKPGVLFVPQESLLEHELVDALVVQSAQAMLSEQIAARYRLMLGTLGRHKALRWLAHGKSEGLMSAPSILTTTTTELLRDPARLLLECFGPAALVVTYDTAEELLHVAQVLPGQLTATIHGETDELIAAQLIQLLARRVGRIVWNGWPTGVSVTHAMQHGGPYPATTASLHTSVGSAAIKRFLRPVCYQGVPDALLPHELQETNPNGIPRWVDGSLRIPLPTPQPR